jgi:hypothetical protein
MKTIHEKAEVDASGRLRLDIACDLPPGPVEVVLVLTPAPQERTDAGLRWEDACGLGREIWEGIDAQVYVDALRSEWEHRRP